MKEEDDEVHVKMSKENQEQEVHSFFLSAKMLLSQTKGSGA
jgi:hypothetical protein